jgi:hypothetical protein
MVRSGIMLFILGMLVAFSNLALATQRFVVGELITSTS